MTTETRPAGRFGRFGGQYVPETLMPALAELAAAHIEALADRSFTAELDDLLRDFAGRPTPLYRARRLESALPGAGQIWLKREDLLHTGAHKLNNTLGQVLLARRMGKRRIIAETGAGQHGVATAAVCARFGLECTVYMGEVDMQRQRPNVQRMRLFGAEVRPALTGSRTLKDATSEAIRDWVASVATTYYIIGSVVGPHPYPALVADFQAVIGREAREQILAATGRLPSHALACVGGGSNAIGLFRGFLEQFVPLLLIRDLVDKQPEMRPLYTRGNSGVKIGLPLIDVDTGVEIRYLDTEFLPDLLHLIRGITPLKLLT